VARAPVSSGNRVRVLDTHPGFGWDRGMRVTTLVLSIAVVGCQVGCKTTGGTVGTTIAAVGTTFSIAHVGTSFECPEDEGCGFDLTRKVWASIAVAGLIVALISETSASTPAPVAEPPPPAPVATAPVARVPAVPLVEAVPAKDPMAAQLTLEAHRAALRGQCASIGPVGARVRELDPDYHAQVFVVDAAIAGCL